jgi:hypothetical protein
MTSPSSEAVTSSAIAVTVQADPVVSDDSGPAILALPERTGGATLPAAHVRTTQPPVGPDLLRRVLDGLKRL